MSAAEPTTKQRIDHVAEQTAWIAKAIHGLTEHVSHQHRDAVKLTAGTVLHAAACLTAMTQQRPDEADPDREIIRELCRAIRAGWSNDEESTRRVGPVHSL